MVAIKKNANCLSCASERLRDDKEIVLEAVKNEGSTLEYSSVRLRDDRDVVIEATKKDGSALQFASDRLKDDKDVVLEAVKSEIKALRYASERLQNDKELLELLEMNNNRNMHVILRESLWYKERMEILANIREKELLENAITPNEKIAKKVKF